MFVTTVSYNAENVLFLASNDVYSYVQILKAIV